MTTDLILKKSVSGISWSTCVLLFASIALTITTTASVVAASASVVGANHITNPNIYRIDNQAEPCYHVEQAIFATNEFKRVLPRRDESIAIVAKACAEFGAGGGTQESNCTAIETMIKNVLTPEYIHHKCLQSYPTTQVALSSRRRLGSVCGLTKMWDCGLEAGGALDTCFDEHNTWSQCYARVSGLYGGCKSCLLEMWVFEASSAVRRPALFAPA